eukprot:TRINITY_DN120759_c0_g1_i1.p1 TRINITY_DN120759_c0_g1~~TRINITY_DN120759_c0_g1_i1.p1  ORF type:complete len:1120 (-),score=247.04 TRINITY_DN120759_c0_g1_i1:127-3486(-)
MGALPSAEDEEGEGSSPRPPRFEGRVKQDTPVDSRALLWRLRFERRLLNAVWGAFALLAITPFLLSALYVLSPASELQRVHRAIEEHFRLDEAEAVREVADIYAFAASFGERQEEIRPNSWHFWCEERYLTVSWDEKLGVPIRRCNSPRQKALGVPDRPDWWWTTTTAAPGARRSKIEVDINDSENASEELGNVSLNVSSGALGDLAEESQQNASNETNESNESNDTNETMGDVNVTNRTNATCIDRETYYSEVVEHVSVAVAGADLLQGSGDVFDGDLVDLREDRTLPFCDEAAADPDRCLDDEEGLQNYTGEVNATCAGWVGVSNVTLCTSMPALVYCRVSCGYCPPITYVPIKEYIDKQYSITRPVMLQTRRIKREACGGFAATYWEEAQIRPSMAQQASAKPDLGLKSTAGSPIVDDESFPCMDMNRRPASWAEAFPSVWTYLQKEDDNSTHALADVRCPPCLSGEPCDARRRSCIAGINISARQSVRHRSVFPELLAEPSKDVGFLRGVEWIDAMTETVSVSAIVYTQEYEVYTLVSVDFLLGTEGIRSEVKLKSHREVSPLTTTALIVCAGVAFLVSLIHCGININMFCAPAGRGLWRFSEIVTFGAVLCFVVGFSAWYTQLPALSEVCKGLLDKFLATERNLLFPQRESQADGVILKAYFAAAEELLMVALWQQALHVVGFFVLIFLGLLLMSYVSVHPQSRVVGTFVRYGLYDAIHYLAVFVLAFVGLATWASVLFGPVLQDYASVSAATLSQISWLVGDVDRGFEAARKLTGVRQVCFVAYEVAFLVLVCWSGLFTLLALVMDSLGATRVRRTLRLPPDRFCCVSTDRAEPILTAGIVQDVKRVLYTFYKPWPAPFVIIQTIEMVLEDPVHGGCETVPAGVLRNALPEVVERKGVFKKLLNVYDARCKGALLPSFSQKQGLHPECTAWGVPAEAYEARFGTPFMAPRRRVEHVTLEEVLPFVDIPSFDEETQAELRNRIERMTLRWLQMAGVAKPDWWELSSTMACSLVQEVLYVLLQAEEEKAHQAPDLALEELENPQDGGAAAEEGVETTVKLEQHHLVSPHSTNKTAGGLPDNLGAASALVKVGRPTSPPPLRLLDDQMSDVSDESC